MSESEGAGGSRSETCPEEDSVTMVDVLQEEQELDDDAAAVLGGSDDRHCSYTEGYVKRQPLYACLTCAEEERPAGVCLACSYHCHETHELVELYTKRTFRCDCGGPRQPGVTCRLTEKSAENTENTYNQNFVGRYCVCGRPYPDPEDDTADQMIQCVVCEDWYHGRHLGVTVPEDSEYAEMVCSGCVKRLPFLRAYATDQEMSAGRTTSDEAKPDSVIDKEVADTSSSCRLKRLRPPPADQDGALFWKAGWRGHLCTCDQCQAEYRRSKVGFLLDEEDTVAAYEARGRGGADSYAAGMEALSSMDRIQQVEVVHEYNDLKSELMTYLKKFADNKKVVRKEDIQEFFTGMKSRKRQKTEVSHFCR